MSLERAYALPPDYQSTLTIETQDNKKELLMPACNHFEEEIRYFVANRLTKAAEWRDEFLNQSRVIMEIKNSLMTSCSRMFQHRLNV